MKTGPLDEVELGLINRLLVGKIEEAISNEREACALIAEEQAAEVFDERDTWQMYKDSAESIARKIRNQPEVRLLVKPESEISRPKEKTYIS